ncbi:MAG TPA: ferredoxin family protein [Verrucomicrobiae bacterium]|nr:ferredoxin family protein [Verrucomicrobiae bacterium]
MSVYINRSLCNGCGTLQESRCSEVCPGDLLYRDSENKCAVRDPWDCWDCASCIKECPRQAIEIRLPVQLGGRGSALKARSLGGRIVWKLVKPNGSEEIFDIVTINE